MMNASRLIKLGCMSLFIVAITALQAQRITNSGKEFWFAFPEMFDRNTANSDYWVNITSNQNAAGTVSIPGTSFSAAFSVSPGQIAKVNLPRNDVYLNGSDSVFNRAIHISSNNDIVVYAVHLKRPRHEATLVLPNVALGTEYRVTTYRSELIGTTLYESEFTVVSNGDTAVVEIVPTGDIANGTNKGVPDTIVIPPNHVYQAQARSDSVDLTGTTIRSLNGKNVAVYAGNVWIRVICNGARDPLLEVMYPTNTWGKNYFALPTPLVNKDYVKVLADEDTTELRRDGIVVATLNAGEFFEDTITTSRNYTANKPISVAQVLVSGGSGSSGCIPYTQTDPSMVMINPTEQMFLDSISFFAVDDPSAQLDTNFVHVITFSTDTALMYLDSVKLNGFQPFPQDLKFSFRSVGVKAGFHRLETKGCGFLAYSMGMGDIISYAYATGVSLVDLDNSIQFTNAINGSDTICLGDTVQFKSVSFGNPLSFVWNFGDGNTDTVENPLHGYGQNGTYVVSLTTQYSCATVTTRDTVEVPPPPLANLGPDTTLCEGDTLTVSVNTHVFKAKWSDGSTDQFLKIFKPGQYWVEVSNFCGADTDSVAVQIITSDSIDAGRDTIVCQNNEYVLGGNPSAPPGSTILWSPAGDLNADSIPNPIATPKNAGNQAYVLQVTMGSNCVLRDTVNLQVLSNPPLDLGGDVVICSDTVLNVQLGGNPTGPASSTYIWGPAGKLKNSNSPNPTTTDALSRTYTLLVIDTSGCKNVDSVRVRKFSFTVSSGEVKCGGDSLQLSVNDLFGTPPFQYKWRPNTFLSTDTIANPIAVPDSSISYSLVITDSNNCTDSTSVPVNVRLTAQADFNLKIRSGCEMAKISTDNLGDPAHQYIWYHNDVAISSGFNAELETDFSTQHNIRLWVMTADSCVDTSTQIANVLSAEALFGDTLPNVFTPNNDGINDKIDFALGNDLRECATVFVYNRWGELVFESTHGYPIWDGTTFTGEPCKVGVYFYKLDVNGEAFTGYVTLLR